MPMIPSRPFKFIVTDDDAPFTAAVKYALMPFNQKRQSLPLYINYIQRAVMM